MHFTENPRRVSASTFYGKEQRGRKDIKTMAKKTFKDRGWSQIQKLLSYKTMLFLNVTKILLTIAAISLTRLN